MAKCEFWALFFFFFCDFGENKGIVLVLICFDLFTFLIQKGVCLLTFVGVEENVFRVSVVLDRNDVILLNDRFMEF